MSELKFICLSETALLLSYDNSINEHQYAQLMQVKQHVEQNPFKGFVEIVPAYNSLTIYYNPHEIEKDDANKTLQATLINILQKQIKSLQSEKINIHSSHIEIPVCYDIEFGIDLFELSKSLNLSIKEIIQLHNSKIYKVFMLGFTPGFGYMGIVDKKIISQRKKQPRLKVEKGAVAIAGNQTGIYPLETPGGWNIIGRTPLQLFNKSKEHPFLLKAGDEVKFISITKEEFNHWVIK